MKGEGREESSDDRIVHRTMTNKLPLFASLLASPLIAAYMKNAPPHDVHESVGKMVKEVLAML